jgi:hypothetical protein
MWFNSKDIKHLNPIAVDLHGYVLPHAGTQFTGSIISHTLRFRPIKKFKTIVILYYPATNDPDVMDLYHEYYVPWKSLVSVFGTEYMYKGYNIAANEYPMDYSIEDTLWVVSADFSHFMPFLEAIELENKAANSLMFKELFKTYSNIVDNLHTFKALYNIIPDEWQLQWVGRDRSPGNRAVGYLSFLLRDTARDTRHDVFIDGMFVTVYSTDMVARECQGRWFKKGNKQLLNNVWSQSVEDELIKEVIELGESESRLTGGTNIVRPLRHYSVTYLYKDTKHPFIRGWHGLLHNAFYLPSVFLENTFPNGDWITASDNQWRNGSSFKLQKTFNKLNLKAGKLNTDKLKNVKLKNGNTRRLTKQPYTLYSSKVVHYIL